MSMAPKVLRLVDDLRKPAFDGLRLGAGHGLDEAEQGLGGGYIGEAHLAVVSRYFQLVTVCHQLTSFSAQPLFQFVPIPPRGLVIRLLDQGLNDVDHREPPSLRGIIIEPANLVLLEEGGGGK